VTRPAFKLVLAAALLSGCAGAPWEEDGRERRAQPPREEKEYAGVVESVRDAEVDNPRTGVGSMAGAVIGGAVGSGAGRGRGATVGGVIGTVTGAVVGEAAAQASTQPGIEITVKLDAGRTIAVTQPAGETTFVSGDRVRVVSDGRVARVTKIQGER
jgi:outer membrane lipoprotein SlyB